MWGRFTFKITTSAFITILKNKKTPWEFPLRSRDEFHFRCMDKTGNELNCDIIFTTVLKFLAMASKATPEEEQHQDGEIGLSMI